MPGADELAADILQFPVRVGFPENITGLNELIYTPMHATGVGLLRYGLTNGSSRYSPLFLGEHTIFNHISRKMRELVQDIF